MNMKEQAVGNYTYDQALALAKTAFTKDALVLRLEPHPDLNEIVNTLVGSASALAASAAACKRQWCRVFVPGESEPYEIPAIWANSQHKKKSLVVSSQTINSALFAQTKQAVYGCENPQIDLQLLKILQRMIESSRPMSLVRMRDDAQLWINAPMVQLLETSPVEATKRIMADFWLPGDLANLKQQLTQEGRFNYRYQAGLNKNVWANLEARFELVESDDICYRLVTNFFAEPTKRPVLMA
ncbi:hypothetical protein [Phormidium nigroviride]